MPKYEKEIHQFFTWNFFSKSTIKNHSTNTFTQELCFWADHFHLKPMAQFQAPDISDLKCKTRVWNRRLCRTLPASMTSSSSTTCIRQSKTFFPNKSSMKKISRFSLENWKPSSTLSLHIEICLNNLVSKKEEMHLIVDLWNGRSWRRT